LPDWFCDRTARTRSFSSARVVDGEPKMGMSRLPKMGYTFTTPNLNCTGSQMQPLRTKVYNASLAGHINSQENVVSSGYTFTTPNLNCIGSQNAAAKDQGIQCFLGRPH
jgi:hypothetical protein